MSRRSVWPVLKAGKRKRATIEVDQGGKSLPPVHYLKTSKLILVQKDRRNGNVHQKRLYEARLSAVLQRWRR